MEIIDRNLGITTTKKRTFPVSAKVYFIVTAILMIFNIIVYNISTNLVGYLTPEQNFKSSLSTILIVFPLISFVLAVLVALLPYKRKPYRQKYIPAALLILFVTQCLLFIAIVASLIWRAFYLQP